MLTILGNFEKDTNWFFKNKSGLTKDYENKFVAIENEDVIDSDKNLDVLIKRLEKAGKNPATLVIKYIKKINVILR